MRDDRYATRRAKRAKTGLPTTSAVWVTLDLGIELNAAQFFFALRVPARH